MRSMQDFFVKRRSPRKTSLGSPKAECELVKFAFANRGRYRTRASSRPTCSAGCPRARDGMTATSRTPVLPEAPARPERRLNKSGSGADVTLQQRHASSAPTELGGRFLNHPGLRFLCVALHRLETRLRGAAAPAARCGSGQWRRVGSPLCRTARRLFRSHVFRAVAHRLE
jgi:hypothetical protein